MLLHSRAQRGVFLTQLQQVLHVGVEVLLLRRASSIGKGIVLVTGKSAGKVVPVIRVIAASHTDLIAVVKLRNSPQSRQQRKRELQLPSRVARLSQKPLHVMVADESDQQLGMRVEPIL